MQHLPARVVMDARHYHQHGVTVSELARLFGVRRDTLSRAVNRRTHANLTEPDGYRPRPLPVRAAPPPRPRHVRTAPPSPEERQRLYDSVTGKKPKPAPLSASERALAQVKASGTGFTPAEWERYQAEQRAEERQRRARVRPAASGPPRSHIPSGW